MFDHCNNDRAHRVQDLLALAGGLARAIAEATQALIVMARQRLLILILVAAAWSLPARATARPPPPSVKRSAQMSPTDALTPTGHPESEGAAEEADDPFGVWAQAGLGPGGMGIVGALATHLRLHSHLGSFRYLDSSEFEFFSDVSPQETLQEYALLYGFVHSSPGAVGYHAAAAAGLSLVSGVRRGAFLQETCAGFFGCVEEYETLRFSTGGLAMDAQLVGHLGPLGLGVALILNLNPKRSVAGGLLTLHLGYFGRYGSQVNTHVSEQQDAAR